MTAANVLRAWVVKGPNATHHDHMKAKLHQEWPTLAQAIDSLVNDALANPTVVIHHGNPDALATAQVEGFDEAMRQSFGGAEQRNWAIDQVLLALREGGEAELGVLSDSTARPIAARIVDRLISEADLVPTFDVRYCRACRCTEDDCSGCIDRTGQACHWVDWDLCSACEARVYVVCDRLLDPETNEHCEFDGYVDVDAERHYRCPGCKRQRPAPEDEKTRIRKETIRDLVKAWPTITRDMVSRGHVRDWLLKQAELTEASDG